jgi:hypothetical protein
MSQQDPRTPYIYQPEPDGDSPYIYAIAGPGAEEFRGVRFTKEAAERELAALKARLIGRAIRRDGA